MKIKNLIIKPITVVLISLLFFVSCTDNAFDISGKETGKVTISISGKTPKDLTLTPSAPVAEDINWTYRLRKTNGTNGIGQISEETKITGSSVTTAVSIGNWTAEVWGYRDATYRELVYHGTGNGDISRSGGTIVVNAVTMTDAGMAHAFSASDTPKATADLVLMPVGVEGDVAGTVRHSLEWIVGGETISTWLWKGGAWTSGGTTVGENGVVVNVEPGTTSVVAIVRDAGGDMIAAEGWKTQEFAMNCTYTIDGIMRSDLVVINSFFDIDPSSEMPADNAMVIGYREASKGVSASIQTTDLSGTITFPYVLKSVNPIETPVTPSELGLEKIYVTNATDLVASGAMEAWFGKTAKIGSNSSVNRNIKLAEVRYVADTTSIQNDSLYLCQNIESVTLPNGITSIGDHAFSSCTGLTSVTIPSSVTSIGFQTFLGCTGLTSITIPASVTSIGSYAFNACSGLTEINVEEGNSSYVAIEGVLFLKEPYTLVKYPEGKMGEFSIPERVTSIKGYAFAGCTGLTSVTIPSSVTSIGGSAFQDCTGLTDVTYTGTIEQWDVIGYATLSTADVTCTDGKAVFRIQKDTDYTYLYGLTPYGKTNYTEITIPEGVTYIVDFAFAGCTGLSSVTIPSSVTSIGFFAFEGCTGLSYIYIDQPEDSLNLTNAEIPSGCTVLWRGQF